jgi:S-adenosylmethionine/arginine decarboxylase-like enzyme
MVQIYNPNTVGKHILIDVKNINGDKLKLAEDIKPFMDKVVEELKLNVVGECSHQFKKDNCPYGVTMIYLLAESYWLKVIYLFIHLLMKEK